MEFLSLLPLIISSLILLVHYLKPKNAKSEPAKHYGFPTVPVLGALPELIKNRHRFFDWITEVLNGCPTNTAVLLRPGNTPNVITAHPANMEHILKTNFENYPKGKSFIPLFQEFLGHGIMNVDGPAWKAQRAIAMHDFNAMVLRKFITENTGAQIRDCLVPALEKSEAFDLQDVFKRFTLDNVCKMVLDVDPASLGAGRHSDFLAAFDQATSISFRRVFTLSPLVWKLKRFLNIGSERELKRAISVVHGFVDNIIRDRMEMKSAEDSHDLLARFMNKEEYRRSPELLRDIVVDFILAGKEGMSSTLSWFFSTLASAPNVEKKILAEIKEVRARSGRSAGDDFTVDDVKEMVYLHAAFSETMRLHPPVGLNTKECLKDDILPDGTRVKKGWGVLFSAYAMGRMESLWGKDWAEFRPERWFDDNGKYKQVSHFRYPVFNAGPRTCLGQDMAYIQMKMIAATVLERFVVEVLDKNTLPVMMVAIVQKMRDGLRVKMHQRSNNVDNPKTNEA